MPHSIEDMFDCASPANPCQPEVKLATLADLGFPNLGEIGRE
jgi:hypothetical protein